MGEHRFTEYLEYLDKEMTIMGLLSTFSVTVIGALLAGLTSLDPHTLSGAMWSQAAGPMSSGIAMLLLAAYLFYLQRAHLAWHYGHITYRLAAEDEAGAMESLRELQGRKVEWRCYLHGLNLLAAGLLLVAGAFWYTRRPPSSASWHFTAAISALLIGGTLLLEVRIRRDLIGPSRRVIPRQTA